MHRHAVWTIALTALLASACSSDAATTKVAPATNGGSGGSDAGPDARIAEPPPGGQGDGLFPCEVDPVLTAKCRGCHMPGGKVATPFYLYRPSVLQQRSIVPASGGKLIGQLTGERIHGFGDPMPPLDEPRLTPRELAILDAWLQQGGPAGTACAPAGTGGAPGTGGVGGGGGTDGGAGGTRSSGGADGGGSGGADGGGSGGGDGGGADGDGAGGADGGGSGGADGGGSGGADGGDASVSVPPNPEDCDYMEIRARANSNGDPFPVPVGTSELYQCFGFNIPPTATNQAISFTPLIDNAKVIHHWMLYAMSSQQTNGQTSSCLGSHLDGQLIAGWAPGAGPWLMPADVGVDLGSGNFLLEVHYNNFGSTNEVDRSGVQVCRAKTKRPNTTTISWLGNDTFGFATPGIPPFTQDAQIKGTCRPDITQPIHIVKSWPYMQRLGRRMEALIHRADGGVETLFDHVFDGNAQLQYDTPAVLNPGDWIETICHYQNDGPNTVGFGVASTVETCYNFTQAYPPDALVAGFGVHTNTCM